MDCGHESLHNAKIVMDSLCQESQTVGELVVQEALLIILRKLSYSSWFMPITNMGASTEGAAMNFLAPLFK